MDSASLLTSFALGIFLLMTPIAAHASAVANATGAQSDNSGFTVALLEEESIPAADLPSPAAGSTPAPGAAPNSVQNPGPGSSPGVQVPPNPGGWSTVPATPAGQATPDQEDNGDEDTDQASQPSPAAAPTEVPAAMDIGSLTPTVQVSDSSLAQLISTAPNPARAASLRITEKGRLAIEHGDVDGAIRNLAYAVSIDPSNSYAYLYLGRAYIEKKNYAQASTFFKRAEIGLAANSAWLGDVYVFEGLCYEQSGKQNEAAAAYQKALALAPGNLRARVGYTRLAPSVTAPPAASQASEAAETAPDASGPPPPPAAAPPGPPPRTAPVPTD